MFSHYLVNYLTASESTKNWFSYLKAKNKNCKFWFINKIIFVINIFEGVTWSSHLSRYKSILSLFIKRWLKCACYCVHVDHTLFYLSRMNATICLDWIERSNRDARWWLNEAHLLELRSVIAWSLIMTQVCYHVSAERGCFNVTWL